MDTTIQSQLNRVETALTTLIDSIAAYNPSIPAANTLFAADDELQKGLKQLAQHQANHARILALHEKIGLQNAQIISTLTSLADLRNDLLSTPSSLPPKDAREVPYTELLDYAKHISRYTVPPTLRPPPPPVQQQVAADLVTAVNGDVETAKEGDGVGDGRGMGTDALGEDERKWLEVSIQPSFVPWVNDDTMRRGALAQIQAIVESGEDPADVKPEGLNEEKSKEEGEGMEDVVKERVGDGDGRDMRRIPENKPTVFSGLDLYDPDEDED